MAYLFQKELNLSNEKSQKLNLECFIEILDFFPSNPRLDKFKKTNFFLTYKI